MDLILHVCIFYVHILFHTLYLQFLLPFYSELWTKILRNARLGEMIRKNKFMHALSIQNLKKVYKNNLTALKEINLEVMEGDFFALLGPNGAGKSTTISIICSLVNKT